MGNIATTMATDGISRVRAAGIPVLMGTDTGLRALKHFTSYRPGSVRALTAPVKEDGEKIRRWKDDLCYTGLSALSSADGYDLLAAFGIEVAPFARIASVADLERFLECQTLPIVLKLD